MFSDISTKQGNVARVATPLTCGGICKDLFIANFLLSVTVKEFWTLVNIWWRYRQEFAVLFFDSQCVLH